MIEPQVCLLTREEIAQHWGAIEWRLEETPRLRRFYSKEDIIDKLCKNEMQCWTAGTDLVLLTIVGESPIGRVMQIIWAHGSGLMEHFEELREKFHMFAYMAGAKKIEILGREGWTRRLRQELGFKIEYVAYSADVQKPRMN